MRIAFPVLFVLTCFASSAQPDDERQPSDVRRENRSAVFGLLAGAYDRIRELPTDRYKHLSNDERAFVARAVDVVLSMQTSLEGYGAIARLRPTGGFEAEPLTPPARLRLLALLADRLEREPEYDPSDDFGGEFQFIAATLPGMLTIADRGFREPMPEQAEMIDRYIRAVAAGMKPWQTGMFQTVYFDLLGPWIAEATPTMTRLAEELELAEEERSEREGILPRGWPTDYLLVRSLVEWGCFHPNIRTTVEQLMEHPSDRVAVPATATPGLMLHDGGSAYVPRLRALALQSKRGYVAWGAGRSLSRLGMLDEAVTERMLEWFETDEERSWSHLSNALAGPTPFVETRVDSMLARIATLPPKQLGACLTTLFDLTRDDRDTSDETRHKVHAFVAGLGDHESEKVREDVLWYFSMFDDGDALLRSLPQPPER